MIKLIDKKTEMAIKKYKRLFKNYIFISYLLIPLISEILKKKVLKVFKILNIVFSRLILNHINAV